MLKRIIGAALVIAVSCLFFSCAEKNSDKNNSSERVMDIPIVYKDFLDYTFDGNYTITLTEEGVINEDTEREQAYRYYELAYVRKDGVERSVKVISKEFTENEKKYYESEQRMNNEEMNALCIGEIREAYTKEFIDNILSKHFDITYEEDNMIYKTDEYRCAIGLINPNYLFSMESDIYEKGCRLVDSHIAPETGYKLSEVDLKTAANDKEFLLELIINIVPDADAQTYIDKMNAIINDYFTYTGKPLNCQFVINQGELEKVSKERVFEKSYLMGEEISLEDKKKENEDFSLLKEITRICTEDIN